MSKPTPGPYWTNYNPVSSTHRINGADGYGSIGQAFTKENADMIVEALNAHADMARSLKGKA